MVSLDTSQIPDHTTNPINLDLISSPRISFSSDFLEDMRPNSPLANITTKNKSEKTKQRHVAAENQHFEFLSAAASTTAKISDNGGMISADELFFEGKLLPFWQAHTTERLAKLSLTAADGNNATSASEKEKRKEGHVASESNKAAMSNTWFVDDDPSPRPPKCTVLWKELLRLKKQRRATSTLSPSSSSSSSSSSASSLGDAATSADEGNNKGKPDHGKSNVNNNNTSSINKDVKGTSMRRSGGLERTRSATIRIRPMINVPICTATKKTGFGSSLPPLFPLKKGKLFDR